MSQDLRRERAGAQFDTIAGATNYIAELEALKANVEEIADRYGRFSDRNFSTSRHREELGDHGTAYLFKRESEIYGAISHALRNALGAIDV